MPSQQSFAVYVRADNRLAVTAVLTALKADIWLTCDVVGGEQAVWFLLPSPWRKRTLKAALLNAGLDVPIRWHGAGTNPKASASNDSRRRRYADSDSRHGHRVAGSARVARFSDGGRLRPER